MIPLRIRATGTGHRASRWRKVITLLAVVFTCLLVPGLSGASSASAATAPVWVVKTHRCMNPPRVVNGIRAGLCANMVEFAGYYAFGEGLVFCQHSTPPYADVRCSGVIQGVDIWRQNANGSWSKIVHSDNYSCGSITGGIQHTASCSTTDNETNYNSGGVLNGPCQRYYSVSRASIAITSTVTVSGASVQSPVYETPGCRA